MRCWRWLSVLVSILNRSPLGNWCRALVLLDTVLSLLDSLAVSCSLLSTLAICAPGTLGWRTINLVIEFSKVCRSIKAMKENVSTRNKQEQRRCYWEKKDLCLDFIWLTPGLPCDIFKALTGHQWHPKDLWFVPFTGKYTKILIQKSRLSKCSQPDMRSRQYKPIL